MDAAENKVPPAAAWLGGLGALPFIGLAGSLPFLVDAPRVFAAHALAAYGATILSFLGGIQWGLAIGPARASYNPNVLTRLIVSVFPSLVAWTALLSAETIGLYLLATAVVAMLWVDLRATRAGHAPRWYPKLRIPLSCVVIAALLFGAMA